MSPGFSIIAPCAPSSSAVPTGRTGRKKPRPLAGGVVRVEALPLNQRARPPGAPPLRVLLVALLIRPASLISGISRHASSASRLVRPPRRDIASIARSLLERFSSLIVDFGSLMGRFNSLFAEVGNLRTHVQDINYLPQRSPPPAGAEPAISVFLPVDQGSGPKAAHPAVSPFFVLGTIELSRCGDACRAKRTDILRLRKQQFLIDFKRAGAHRTGGVAAGDVRGRTPSIPRRPFAYTGRRRFADCLGKSVRTARRYEPAAGPGMDDVKAKTPDRPRQRRSIAAHA